MYSIVILILYPAYCAAQGSEWPYRVIDNAKELTDCEGLGFPNATKNTCGYCTEGNTGLPKNYSKDCSGSCARLEFLDCTGVCGGGAYVDECSGECIGGRSGRTEMDVRSYRDCRGYCTSSGGQYYMDGCGVCHTGTSPFQDCTNRCHLPGQEELMAKLVCGRCVGGTSGFNESEVLDACGNCKSEEKDCPCNGTGKPDFCGLCNGGGKSCMVVKSFQPRAIPANVKAMVTVEGAFRGRTNNLKCLFKGRLDNDGYGNVTEFTGNGNGTHVKCQVKLKPGSYRVGVKLDVGQPPEIMDIEEQELLAHEEAEYMSMSPQRAVFDRTGSPEFVVTFSGGKVPPLPLICIITGEGWPYHLRLSPSDVNTLDACVIPNANSSMKLNIAQSLNGIHAFKKSFEFKFFASPPEMRKYYIAEDGHAVVVVFDRPVNICELKDCTQILNAETLSRLGEGVTCQWATKQQLIIIVQDPIKTGSLKVTFKKGILKQDGQQYALPKTDSLTIDVWYPQPVSNAQVAISGPSTVPYCGIFILVGHFSSPKGDAQFFWTATRADQRSLEAIVANALLGMHSASLTLDATLLDVEMNYTFILTAEHPVNEKYEARHVVSRKPYVGPLVTAYSDVMTESSITVDQRVVLQADLSIPECSQEAESLRMMWTVDTPRVKFNFKERKFNVYKIEPYSLPENTIVVFSANAYFGNMINVTSSRITLRVEPAKLKAAIKGTSKRYVGNKEGNLVLENENLNMGIPLVYQWKCSDQNNQVCYNYQTNSTEALLIPRRLQNKPKLVLSCNSLKAGQILMFELQIFNANNRNQYSQTAVTTVVVESGNIPMVTVDSVIADGTDYIERHPITGAYSIPAGLPVTIYATTMQASSPIKSVKWEIKGFSTPFTFSTMNGKTFLSLEEGFLVGHGIYLIGLSACDQNMACGIANLTIHAIPGIALCKLETIPFVEYDQVELKVTGCSIPPGRQPVNYQLYLHSLDGAFPLTSPQTPTVFNIIAPPQQANNTAQMSIQVCDKYTLCKLFPGPLVRVSPSEDKEADRTMLLNKALKSIETSDPFTALSLFLTAATDAKDPLDEVETANMITAATKAVSNRYINAGQLSLIYSAMLPLIRQRDNRIKSQALAVIRRATRSAYAHNVKIPTSILVQGHNNAAEALQCKDPDPDVSKNVKRTFDYFSEKIGSTIPLGNRVLLNSKFPGYPSTLIFRQLPSSRPIYIQALSDDGMVQGSVKFEEPVNDRIRKRKCDKKANCEGIIVALTLYPTRSPYPSTNKKTSPVMDVSLRKPENGLPFRLKDLQNAIKLSLTHKGNYSDAVEKGVTYKCFYFNNEKNEWQDNGLVTLGIEGNSMSCWSSHLTPFAVLEIYNGLSTASIVGIVVTALMGVFIIMMFGFFFLRKKQAAATRVSSEALQPKRQSKLHGMNGNTATVKTITP